MENVAPLHLAVIVNNTEAVRLLVRPRNDMKASVSINQRVKGCLSTALHLAILLNRREVIPHLISSGADTVVLKDANGFTAFELAVALKSPLTKVLYQEYYSRRAFKYSFLFQYLSVEVKEDALKELLTLGDNLNFDVGGESIFVRILRTYHHKNLLKLVQFVLERVNLSDEESKLFSSSFGCGHRSFPPIFQPGRSLFSTQGSSATSKRKGYNSLAVAIVFCRRPTSERISLMKLLMSSGSDVLHLTRRKRSLLHLCTKSRLSSVDEAVFLIQQGIPVTYTDVRQAIKYSRLDFLGLFLQQSNPSDLNLKVNLPDAMSMLVMKSVPSSLMQKQGLTQEEAQSAFIKYFSILIEDHGLDPSREEDFYPLPLLHLLIFKNNLFSNFYLPVIHFIVNIPSINLMYEPRGSFGNAVTYAGSLRDWGLYKSLVELIMPPPSEAEAQRSLRRTRISSDSSCTSSSFSSTMHPRNGSTSSSCTSSTPLHDSDQFSVTDVDQVDGVDPRTNRYSKNSPKRPDFPTRVELSVNSKRRFPTDHPVPSGFKRQHHEEGEEENHVELSPETERRLWKRETKEWVNLIRSQSYTNIDVECSFALKATSSVKACDSCHSLQVILEEDPEDEEELLDEVFANKEANQDLITRQSSFRNKKKASSQTIDKKRKGSHKDMCFGETSMMLSNSVSLSIEGM
jgi:hypothetical protein